MRIWEDFRNDWERIRKWLTEARNFLLTVMLISSFTISVIWLLTIQVISATILIGIIALISLIASVVGSYAYMWYIQKQLVDRNTKIEELSNRLRKVEDENLLLRYENSISKAQSAHQGRVEEKECKNTEEKNLVKVEDELKKFFEILKASVEHEIKEEKAVDTEDRSEAKNTQRSD